MTSLRRAMLAAVILAALLAASMPFLRVQQSAFLFVGVLLIEFVLDIVATWYVASLVTDDDRRPRSWLLLLIFTTCAMTTIGLAPIALLVVNSAMGNPPLPDGWGNKIAGMGLVIAGAVPILKAVVFRMVRGDRTEVGWSE